MNEFSEIQAAVGVLKIGSDELQDMRCHVYYNPIDTSNLRASLFSNFRPVQALSLMRFAQGTAYYEANFGTYLLKWEGTLHGVKVQNGNDEFATFDLQSFTEVISHSSAETTSANFSFYISDSQLFKRGRAWKGSHYKRGLLFGWLGEDEDGEWIDDDVKITDERWEVVIGRVLLFAKHDSDVDSTIVKDHLGLSLEVTEPNINIDGIFEEATKVADSYVRMLSLLECREIGWTFCSANTYLGDTTVTKANQYHRLKNRSYRDDSYVLQATDAYRGVLREGARSYRGLDAETRKSIDLILDTYLLISDERIFLDTRLAHAQTALELIIKRYPEAQRQHGFSRKLVVAIEAVGVEWTDQFGYINRDSIFSETDKANFIMVDIRNGILHDGEIPEHLVQQLYPELERSKLLLRRLISKLIGFDLPGIDYRAPSMTISRTPPTGSVEPET